MRRQVWLSAMFVSSLLVPDAVESWTTSTSFSDVGLQQQNGISTAEYCSKRRSALHMHQQTCNNYDGYYHNPHQQRDGTLALTPEQAQQLARAIYDLNDKVQYYYEAKLKELNTILEHIRELQRLQSEYQEQLVQRQYQHDQYHIQSSVEPGLHNHYHGYPLDGQIDYWAPQQQEPEQHKIPSKLRKLKAKVPAKYYQKITPAYRPNPAPGMPITAGETLTANFKSSQSVVVAELESMMTTLKQNQPMLELSLKKNAPILTAEFETTVETIIKQIKMAQPMLAAELETALTQTTQNQALLTAELSQLIVDAKQMLSTYLGDLSCLDGVGGCEMF